MLAFNNNTINRKLCIRSCSILVEQGSTSVRNKEQRVDGHMSQHIILSQTISALLGHIREVRICTYTVPQYMCMANDKSIQEDILSTNDLVTSLKLCMCV